MLKRKLPHFPEGKPTIHFQGGAAFQEWAFVSVQPDRVIALKRGEHAARAARPRRGVPMTKGLDPMEPPVRCFSRQGWARASRSQLDT